MSDKIVSSLFAALIGGIVGACVVFFMSGKTKFEALEVGSLTITKQATLLNAEGKDDVVIKEGSVLANNVILGKKFIGQQYQGHVFVGNRIFTSPDDLMATSMEKWKFFTEIGSSEKVGGELIVRSPHGANVVGQPVNDGILFRAGFGEDDAPQLFVKSNQNGGTLHIPFLPPRQQPNAETPQENGTGTPANAAAPAPATETSATAPATPPASVVTPTPAVAENTGNATK
ncbi:MAG: hypothetical protein LBP87_01835 [Planctomycetaceae bacterium]|jgi:hypothetical protein|nr:hypothetical protein [Planctomycetaceae bacterium]